MELHSLSYPLIQDHSTTTFVIFLEVVWTLASSMDIKGKSRLVSQIFLDSVDFFFFNAPRRLHFLPLGPLITIFLFLFRLKIHLDLPERPYPILPVSIVVFELLLRSHDDLIDS